MLCGAKKGKRKRKDAEFASAVSLDNRSAADNLRKILNSGEATKLLGKNSSTKKTVEPRVESVWERLQRQGKITVCKDAVDENVSSNTILLRGVASGSPIRSKEDSRRGSRKGKLKKEPYMYAEKDKTVRQMLAEEHQQKLEGFADMDECFARNVKRLGSRYKGTDFGQPNAGASTGADEEDYTGDGGADLQMFASQSCRLTGVAALGREKSRQTSLAAKQLAATNKCWWWMEASTFRKNMLLSLGDHVSLVMSPHHLSLVNSQCFLVPVKYSESFVSCENEVWDEVQRYQSSLRSFFRKEGKGVLFCETVLTCKELWQTRIDVIPVPAHIEQDAKLYFKSALTEESEEWGTHTKLLSTGCKGGVRHTVPKGFPYFSVEWEGGGFAQIIEKASFPKNFGLDIIAGMMGLDPVGFNSKSKSSNEDQVMVKEFMEYWNKFDWTLEGNER